MVSAKSAVINEPSSSARGTSSPGAGRTSVPAEDVALRAAAFSHLPSSVLFQIGKYTSVMICHELNISIK